jgi:hypothetical protein
MSCQSAPATVIPAGNAASSPGGMWGRIRRDRPAPVLARRPAMRAVRRLRAVSLPTIALGSSSAPRAGSWCSPRSDSPTDAVTRAASDARTDLTNEQSGACPLRLRRDLTPTTPPEVAGPALARTATAGSTASRPLTAADLEQWQARGTRRRPGHFHAVRSVRDPTVRVLGHCLPRTATRSPCGFVGSFVLRVRRPGHGLIFGRTGRSGAGRSGPRSRPSGVIMLVAVGQTTTPWRGAGRPVRQRRTAQDRVRRASQACLPFASHSGYGCRHFCAQTLRMWLELICDVRGTSRTTHR